jgi:hypothetical protein
VKSCVLGAPEVDLPAMFAAEYKLVSLFTMAITCESKVLTIIVPEPERLIIRDETLLAKMTVGTESKSS